MGYGDYHIRNVTISRIYFVEGLGHNLFSVGQFCDSNLEVAFRQHTCFIRNLEGVDLLTGSQGNNLYTLSLRDMMASSPICLLSKASNTMSWLWHRHQSHLNFDNGTEFVNQTLREYYEQVGSQETSVARSPHQNGVVERPNRTLIEASRTIESLGKLQPKADIGIFIGYAPTKKAFQIYNRHTRRIIETIHVDFDELSAMASEKSSELVDAAGSEATTSAIGAMTSGAGGSTLCGGVVQIVLWYLDPGCSKHMTGHRSQLINFVHKFLVARSPQQNGVVERRNCTLIEAARTIQNLGKLQPKAGIGIFIGYAPTKKALRIYNRRTRRIVETIHVDFDELTTMASEQSSSGPALNEMTPVTISSRLVPKPYSSTPYVSPSRYDWDLLFQSMFDELLTPPPSVDPPAPEFIAPITDVIHPVQAESIGTPSSTTVDQDAPSPSKSQTTPGTQSSVIPYDVEKNIHDIEVAHMGNDPLFGLQISQSPRGIFINQSKYALESLKKYGFESCDPVDTLMVDKSKLDEDKEGKAVDPSHYRVDTLMVDKSKLDEDKEGKAVDPSHYRAEYIALSGCGAQILWMRSQLTDYGLGFNKIPMYCDNKSAIALCCNNVQHSRSKHIDMRYHFIKEQVENGVIELYFVNTEYQLADLFTKALGRDRIKFLINKLGMRSFTPETLKQLMDEVDE
nr:retrotransposon protein, putative, unclassified [Tanacetum cinerariifolium]